MCDNLLFVKILCGTILLDFNTKYLLNLISNIILNTFKSKIFNLEKLCMSYPSVESMISNDLEF